MAYPPVYLNAPSPPNVSITPIPSTLGQSFSLIDTEGSSGEAGQAPIANGDGTITWGAAGSSIAPLVVADVGGGTFVFGAGDSSVEDLVLSNAFGDLQISASAGSVSITAQSVTQTANGGNFNFTANGAGHGLTLTSGAGSSVTITGEVRLADSLGSSITLGGDTSISISSGSLGFFGATPVSQGSAATITSLELLVAYLESIGLLGA